MARVCGLLKSGIDLSCERPISRYVQEICLMNYSEVDQSTIVAPWTSTDESGDCDYSGYFEMLTGKSGFKFVFPERGSGVFGTTDTATDDNGYSTFTHHINAMLPNASETDKCRLDALSRGLVVGATKWSDGKVEIYGLRYGLSLDPVTLDPANNGGVTPIILSSLETTPESHLPLNYKPSGEGSAEADFDKCFENEEA